MLWNLYFNLTNEWAGGREEDEKVITPNESPKRFKNFRRDQDLCVGRAKGSWVRLNWDLKFPSQLCSTSPQKNKPNPLITYSAAHLGRLVNYQQDSTPPNSQHYYRPPASVPHASSCNSTLNPAWLNFLGVFFGSYSSRSVRWSSDLLRNYHMVSSVMMLQARQAAEKDEIMLVILVDEDFMCCCLPLIQRWWRTHEEREKKTFITQYQFH